MRRLVEISYLDKRQQLVFRVEEPRQQSFLYSLPPYVREVDLHQEVIIVSNPDTKPLDLSGYYLTDKEDLHRFEFEDGYVLPPLEDVYVYCAPGKLDLTRTDFPKNYVLWTTKDGRPRRKEVLNAGGDKITLIDNNSVEIAALEAVGDGLKKYQLYELERRQVIYSGRLVTALQAFRFIFLALSGLAIVNRPQQYIFFELMALSLDMTARFTDSVRVRNSVHKVLAVLGDRFEIVVLLCALIFVTRHEIRVAALTELELSPDSRNSQFSEPQVSEFFLAVLFVDQLAAWLEALTELFSLSSATSACNRNAKQLERLVETHPWPVTAVTLGNHVALLCVYGFSHAVLGPPEAIFSKFLVDGWICWGLSMVGVAAFLLNLLYRFFIVGSFALDLLESFV